MAPMTGSPPLFSFLESVPVSLQVIAIGSVLTLAYWVYSTLTAEKPFAGFPLIALEEQGLGPKKSWFKHADAVIAKGLKQTSGPFQVMTGTGPKIILPNRFADELRNHDGLNFGEAFAKDFFADYPGFQAHKQGLQDDAIITELVRVKLTQSLGLVTDDLVDETIVAIHDIFGESPDWHATYLKDDCCELVARLSSRVFLGKELCRNRRWLDIAKNYTIDSFIGSFILRMVPPLIRPIAHWFMPHCIRLRGQWRDANKLILPEVQRREERAHKALEAGQKPPKTADTIGWMVEIARGRKVDYVAGQLALTLAAIHTTTEATTQAILDVCENPHILQSLRDEIISVLGQEPWSKTALYKLKLMDSFLKESQRIHPGSSTSMNRLVKGDVQLSDGTILPKGSRIMVAGKFFDPQVYPEPEKFDVARFLHKREEPGTNSNSYQHVTTSAEHMGFGHGQHACPGRFFASNELKIALCHLLLKYDWNFVEGEEELKMMPFENASMVDQKCRVQIRRRKEEVHLNPSVEE